MLRATTQTTLLARWVIPISEPPIENGFVVVADGQIVGIGKRGQATVGATSSTRDLGDVAILPGLVNAHTHLEFSDRQQPIGRPSMELAEWIGEVIRSRSENAGRGHAAAERCQAVLTTGAIEASDSGTALVGEIATTPWPGIVSPTDKDRRNNDCCSVLRTECVGNDRFRLGDPSDNPDTGTHCSDGPQRLEVVAFAEVLGLSATRANERLVAAQTHIGAHPQACGISPHAPYSTPPDLITRCVSLAVQAGCPLAMHVAESPAERTLLSHGRGPFANSLRALGLDLSSIFPWSHREPMMWLIDMLAQAPAALLIHGNDLRPAEINRMASHPSLSVVFCPRTHAYFGHARHPVAELLAAGINVALGTDSRASNPDLQLWREVRFLLNHRQDLTPASVLKMATLGGAVALRRADSHGTLRPGRTAVLAVVPTTAVDKQTLYADLAVGDASSLDALHN